MQAKTSLLISITILNTILLAPLTLRSVNADPGLNLNDPLNTWTPYGPHETMRHVMVKYYASQTDEYDDFRAGGLDIADIGTTGTGPPSAAWPVYDANPDWLLSGVQGSGSWEGIDFNGGSSTWINWGCDWQFYNSPCGVEMRQAFAHLVDRPAFDAIHFVGGGGQPTWDDIPASMGLQSPAGNFCTWDTISNAGCSAATGPYNLANDPSGFATPGSPDFCSAAQHMINAGVAASKAADTCILRGINPGAFTHAIRAKVSSSEPRRSLGVGFAYVLDQLFGARITDVREGDVNTLGHAIVFSEISSPVDDWDFYTYSYRDTGPFPTYLYTQFASKFSYTGICPGGQSVANEPPNPTFTCIPLLDSDLFNAVTTNSETTFDNLIITSPTSAANVAGKNAVSIPAYTLNVRTPALRSVSGLTNARGVGYDSVQDILSAHKGPYVPNDSRFLFNSGAASDTIRWGQAQGTQFLNLFQASSASEMNTISLFYDTLFAANPESTNQVYCNLCQTVNPAIVGGNQEYTVNLRQNLRWQGSRPLTIDAYDVKFSLLNERDYAGKLSSGLGLLSDVQVLSPSTLTIIMIGQSVGHLPNLSRIPIMPRFLWECPASGQSAISGFGPCNPLKYGDVGQVDPGKVDPSFDPLGYGTLLGSGPFACTSIFPEDLGRSGTGCIRNPDGSRAGQVITAGGSLALVQYNFTPDPDPFFQWFRNNDPSWGTGSNAVIAESGGYQEFLWADRFNNGAVTIQDLSSVVNCVGHSSNGGLCTDYAYWNRPAFHPETPNVISTEVGIVASHYGDEWVNPYAWGLNPPPDATLGPMFNIVPHP